MHGTRIFDKLKRSICRIDGNHEEEGESMVIQFSPSLFLLSSLSKLSKKSAISWINLSPFRFLVNSIRVEQNDSVENKMNNENKIFAG